VRYRKRPVEVEAEQWFPGKDVPGVRHFAGSAAKSPGDLGLSECWFVVTIHGQHAYLTPGDWVITESDGVHHYPCKPDEFARIYEPCDPPAVGHPEGVQLGGFDPAEPDDRPLPAGPIGEGR
jgi:hypothetical protein